MSRWKKWIEAQLDAIRLSDRWRQTVAFDGEGAIGCVGGREYANFASNDYLGLASHPAVKAAAIAAVETWGAGASASRLVTGTRTLHHDLEGAIANWKHAERALVFPTGYAANLGVLQVLGHEQATIFSDELNHASLIDGCRLAKARKIIFRHNDVEHLAALMRASEGMKIVVTEAVFSMDGDCAPVQQLLDVCIEQGALLIVDEAHALLSSLPDSDYVGYVRIGTLSKTLGALGGWVAGARSIIDLLVNRARTFIFTTALTPADAAAGLAALKVYRSAEGDALRTRLRGYVNEIRAGHGSPIIPVILGSERAAIAASAALLEQGLYVPAIRPPTVPAGTSRLRVVVSAAHTPPMIEQLRLALANVAGAQQERS